MIKDFHQLIDSLKGKPKIKIAVASAHDADVIKSVDTAYNEGIADAILVGEKRKIIDILKTNNIPLERYDIIVADDSETAAHTCMELVRSGQASIPMKGLLDTKTILKAFLDKKYQLTEGKTLFHIGLAKVNKLDKIFVVSDSAMILEPTLEQKIEMVNFCGKLYEKFGFNNPKIALMSSTEKINDKQKSSYEAGKITEYYMEKKKQYLVYGPLALDNAISLEAAKIKGIHHPVSGNADILIFPNIESANVFIKTLEYFANSEKGGAIVGGSVPLILTSRASSDKSKLNSIALAAFLVNHQIR